MPVFFGHYLAPVLLTYGNHGWLFPVWVLAGTAWFAVPIFFVLSGFLIGGILFDTREREGYLRVFYIRRILRVFPLYYLAILVVLVLATMHRRHLNFTFWSHFFYIQNLFPGYDEALLVRPLNRVVPLWSLAIEEQFYLLWPLVVWLCWKRQTLLRVTSVLIAVSCGLRIVAPLLHWSPMRCYFFTPTRIDAILVGVTLALFRGEPIWNWILPRAKYAAAVGMVAMISFSATSDWLLPNTPLRMAFEVPFANLVAVAVIVAAMDAGNLFSKLCSNPRLCWFGSRVYGMYVIHYLFLGWFAYSFAPWLGRFMPLPLAYALSTASALCLTVMLADLSFRFIERPAMNLKSRIHYGPVRKRQVDELDSEQMPDAIPQALN